MAREPIDRTRGRWPTNPSFSSPAPAAASAPPPPARPRPPAGASRSAARSEDKLEELAAELGGDERAVAAALRRHRAGTTSRRPCRPRSSASAASTPSLANAGFGAKRGFLEEDVGALAGDGPDQRLRRRPLDPRRAPPLPRAGPRPLAADELGRRPPGAARLALLRRRSGRSRRWARRCARRSPTPTIKVTADRAGHGRHAVLRRAASRTGLQGRRHRPRGDVRALPARARGRERDPDPADPPADSSVCGRCAHRPRRHGRVLRELRAAAASRAARQAGRRGGQRPARRRHHRQLRGAHVRRLLGHAGLARAAPVPGGGLRRRPTSSSTASARAR